ncbi:hypothetical protein L249_5217 [Ophiocordyceps polyrhachis-furcata BCC 54312]|uniref:Uncharacterized protein n=1 Tax=Ophiocordyceps polyrhachis-furcata BCC 54312 TaxID=1330021 RepID=A0A367L9E9_9HYPO|nr:hypothetical protein L249_5217 [Ophiocordyceps polyrhachis-furcata BCC 54312]
MAQKGRASVWEGHRRRWRVVIVEGVCRVLISILRDKGYSFDFISSCKGQRREESKLQKREKEETQVATSSEHVSLLGITKKKKAHNMIDRVDGESYDQVELAGKKKTSPPLPPPSPPDVPSGSSSSSSNNPFIIITILDSTMKELIILGLTALSHAAMSPDIAPSSRLLTEPGSPPPPPDWLRRQTESIWNNEQKCLRALSREFHTPQDRFKLCRYFLNEDEGDDHVASDVRAKALRILAECDPVTASGVCTKLEGPPSVSTKTSCFEKLKMDLLKNPDRAWEVCRQTYELGEEGVVQDIDTTASDIDVDIDRPLPRDEEARDEEEEEEEEKEEDQAPESCYENREVIAKACRSIGAPESLGMPGCRGQKSYDETIKLLTLAGLNRLCDQVDRGQHLSESAIGSVASETLTPKAVKEAVEAVREGCRCHREQRARSHEWISSVVGDGGLKTSVRPFAASQTGVVRGGDGLEESSDGRGFGSAAGLSRFADEADGGDGGDGGSGGDDDAGVVFSGVVLADFRFITKEKKEKPLLDIGKML